MQNKTYRECNEIHTALQLLRNLSEKTSDEPNTEDLIEHLAMSVSMVAGTIAQQAYDADGTEIRDTMIDIITALKLKIAGITQFTEDLGQVKLAKRRAKLH